MRSTISHDDATRRGRFATSATPRTPEGARTFAEPIGGDAAFTGAKRLIESFWPALDCNQDAVHWA